MTCDLTSGRLIGNCQSGRAGIKTLFFTKYNDYAALTGITEIGGEITDLGAVSISLFQFDMETNVGSFEETPVVSRESGTAYIQQTINMTLFYVKPADLASLNNLKKGRWVIWAMDFNNKIRMFGEGRGMVATGGSDVSGAGPGDKKGVDLILQGTNDDYAVFMEDFTDTPFDNFANVSIITNFTAQYMAIYNAMTTKPPVAVATAQNQLLTDLIAAGVWVKLDLFYLFAQYSNGAGEALLNWVDPGTFDATLHGTSDPTFASLEGFTGDAVDAYINTNWQAKTDAVKMSQNDAAFGVYCRTASLADKIFGVFDGDYSTNLRLGLANSGGTLSYYINSSGSASVGSMTSAGFFVINRTGASAVEAFKNGSSIDTDTTAAAAQMPDRDFLILAYTNFVTGPASFDNRQISMFFAGSSLTSDDVTALTNAIETYMDSNGKGVIT